MRLGTTTFSFTNEWLTRRYTQAELLERAAAFELGPGLEVVGHQLWRGYPILDRDEVLAFRRLCAGLGSSPLRSEATSTCSVGPAAALPRRVLAALEAQITHRSARVPGHEAPRRRPGPGARAGRAVRRAHRRRPRDRGPGRSDAGRPGGGGDPRVRERLRVAVRRSRARLQRLDDGRSRRRSSTRSAVQAWRPTTSSGSRSCGGWFPRRARCSPRSATAPAASRKTRPGLGSSASDAKPRTLGCRSSLVAHAHAKFWELDDAARADLENPAVLDVLLAGGFEGVIASEWGGSAWVDADDVDAFSLVAHTAAARPPDPSPGGVAPV